MLHLDSHVITPTHLNVQIPVFPVLFSYFAVRTVLQNIKTTLESAYCVSLTLLPCHIGAKVHVHFILSVTAVSLVL